MSVFSMTKTLFKNMIHGPYTVQYPLKTKDKHERTRGKVAIDIDDCIFCSMCQRRCPTGAITVDKGTSSWSIERFSCIQCSYCTEVCPKKCLHMDNQYTTPSANKTRDEYVKCTNTQSLSE